MNLILPWLQAVWKSSHLVGKDVHLWILEYYLNGFATSSKQLHLIFPMKQSSSIISHTSVKPLYSSWSIHFEKAIFHRIAVILAVMEFMSDANATGHQSNYISSADGEYWDHNWTYEWVVVATIEEHIYYTYLEGDISLIPNYNNHRRWIVKKSHYVGVGGWRMAIPPSWCTDDLIAIQKLHYLCTTSYAHPQLRANNCSW